MATLIRLLALVLFGSGAHARLSCPTQLFVSGFDAAPEFGDKAAVRAAVARGEPLRLGWELDVDDDGVGNLSHWADASFLTEWEGEVFAQVQAIHRQRPRRGEATVELPAPWTEWRGILGTDGSLAGALSIPREGGRSGRRAVRIVWCAVGAPAWHVLYRHDVQGEPLTGSLEALHAAIRAGQPVRIGWGLRVARDGQEARSVEHAVSPVFLTIIDGGHVSAQLPEHVAQRGYWDVDQAYFDEPAVMWRGLMTTRGSFDAVWVDRASGEVVRRSPQRAALTWYGVGGSLGTVPPLALEGGVVRDTARESERTPR